MDVYRPLRAALFFYEAFSVLLLAVFLFIEPSLQSFVNGTIFPYLVYLSANALFPLMALFVWLRPEEYRSYLTLYAAGKIIAVVLFYLWEIFTVRQVLAAEDLVKNMILLGGSALLSFMDILSVWGAVTLKNKFRQALDSIQTVGQNSQSGYGGI